MPTRIQNTLIDDLGIDSGLSKLSRSIALVRDDNDIRNINYETNYAIEILGDISMELLASIDPRIRSVVLSYNLSPEKIAALGDHILHIGLTEFVSVEAAAQLKQQVKVVLLRGFVSPLVVKTALSKTQAHTVSLEGDVPPAAVAEISQFVTKVKITPLVNAHAIAAVGSNVSLFILAGNIPPATVALLKTSVKAVFLSGNITTEALAQLKPSVEHIIIDSSIAPTIVECLKYKKLTFYGAPSSECLLKINREVKLLEFSAEISNELLQLVPPEIEAIKLPKRASVISANRMYNAIRSNSAETKVVYKKRIMKKPLPESLSDTSPLQSRLAEPPPPPPRIGIAHIKGSTAIFETSVTGYNSSIFDHSIMSRVFNGFPRDNVQEQSIENVVFKGDVSGTMLTNLASTIACVEFTGIFFVNVVQSLPGSVKNVVFRSGFTRDVIRFLPSSVKRVAFGGHLEEDVVSALGENIQSLVVLGGISTNAASVFKPTIQTIVFGSKVGPEIISRLKCTDILFHVDQADATFLAVPSTSKLCLLFDDKERILHIVKLVHTQNPFINVYHKSELQNYCEDAVEIFKDVFKNNDDSTSLLEDQYTADTQTSISELVEYQPVNVTAADHRNESMRDMLQWIQSSTKEVVDEFDLDDACRKEGGLANEIHVNPASEVEVEVTQKSSKKKKQKIVDTQEYTEEDLNIDGLFMSEDIGDLRSFLDAKYLENFNQSVSTTTTTTSSSAGVVINQGIDNKYLSGRLPELPSSIHEQDNQVEDDGLVLKLDSEYKFLKFTDLQQTKAKNLTSIVCNGSLAEFDFYSDGALGLAHAEQNTPVVFVFAGRKQEALFPKPSAKCKVILVATQEEYLSYKNIVPDLLDVLVIKSINSPTHGDYKYFLSTLNARRLAALIFSQHLNLQHCLFLDDNIQAIPYNACELYNAQLNALEFHQIYSIFLNNRKEYNNPIIFGAATISNRTKDDYSNVFCAKLHFWDIQALRSLNIIDNNLCFMAYPAEHSRYWGEDYLQHLMLQELMPCGSRAVFNTIDPNMLGYIRSKSLGNSCLKSISSTQALYETDILASVTTGCNDELLLKAQNALAKLKIIIKDNIDRYNEQAKIRTDANLLDVHAQANALEVNLDCPTLPLMQGDKFLLSWLQQLSDKLPLLQTVLLPHQVNAVKALIVSNHKQAALTMATGSGKTMLQITLALAALQLNPGKPINIITASQNLVQQFYDDFKKVWHLYKDIFPGLELKQIVKVMSGTNNLTVNLLLMNQPIKSQNFIAIYCVDSYMQMLKHVSTQSNAKFFTRGALTLLDEYHLYSEMQLKDLLKSCAMNFFGAAYGFTATPPKHHNKITKIIYNYDLSMALKDKIISPIQLKKLDADYDRKQVYKVLNNLLNMLCNTDHPNDGKLIEHKVLIYFSRIKDIQNFAIELEKYNIKFYQLHTKNASNETHLLEFRKHKSNCIGLACGQLRVGYSDPYLDTVLYLRSGVDSLDVTQVAGRLMRINQDKPDKIGYMLTFSGAITTEFDIVTSAPSNVEHNAPMLRFSSSSAHSAPSDELEEGEVAPGSKRSRRSMSQ